MKDEYGLKLNGEILKKRFGSKDAAIKYAEDMILDELDQLTWVRFKVN